MHPSKGIQIDLAFAINEVVLITALFGLDFNFIALKSSYPEALFLQGKQLGLTLNAVLYSKLINPWQYLVCHLQEPLLEYC